MRSSVPLPAPLPVRARRRGLGRALAPALALASLTACGEDAPTVAAFEPPNAEARVAAIGPTDGLDPAARVALSPAAFEPVREPGPHDWLASHAEPGRTFEEFVAADRPRPDATRGTLYLQPIGPFEQRAPDLERLRYVLQAYLRLPVELLPGLQLSDLDVRARTDPLTGWRQLLASDVTAVLAQRLPRDAFWTIGLTMEDLFERTDENFVFGAVRREGRVSVQSFLRHDPVLVDGAVVEDEAPLLLTLALKQVVHRAGEALGMQPCTWFRCALNGSNHQLETAAHPLHLCPVCLRKLHACTGFGWEERYRGLARAYADVGLAGPAQWVAARAEAIAGR